jgi:hypothetical protein
MDQIQKSIQARKLGIEENIDTISKGQALPNGTIRKRPNGNFIKTPNGWKYHSKLSTATGKDADKKVARKSIEAPKVAAPKIKVTRNDNPMHVPQSGSYTAKEHDAKPLVAGLTKVMKQSGVDGDWTIEILRGRPNNMGGTGNYYRMKSDNSTSEYKYMDIFGSRAGLNRGDATLARVELYDHDGNQKHRFDMGFYQSDNGITEQEQSKKDKLQSIIGDKTAIWAESAHIALLDYALKQAK